MNILHFATHDTAGGAAKAAYRLHTALRDAGHSSQMIVRHKTTDDEDVQQAEIRLWQSRWERMKRYIPLIGEHRAAYKFNFDRTPPINWPLFYSRQPRDVDIIYLHWITGLLTTKAIRTIYSHHRQPLVWSLMDYEPLTGGCHYPFDCDGFTRKCGRCPQLGSNSPRDRSRVVWQRKHRYLQKLPIVFVAHANGTMDRVRESSLFRDCRVETIPLAIDTTVFRPFDQRVARDLLHVPQDKRVVFFGATSLKDSRKGMHHLVEALQQLASMVDDRKGTSRYKDIFLLAAGREAKTLLESQPFQSRQLGYLEDDVVLALAYQAADVFACPSTEDAGPMMIPEAMLCGTPVVAFNTGIAPDLIESLKTGYLATYKDSGDLAHGLYALLTTDNLSAIGITAHKAAIKKHSPPVVAARHLELFNALLDRAGRSACGQRPS